MTGGLGNDTYYVDASGDTVTEALNAGIDIVRSSVDWILGDHFEKLYLLGTAKDASGNALTNFIYGNASNNRIDGLAGADRAWGYGGNDEYFKDSAGDLFYETIAGAAGGTDTVVSSVNHALGINFENVILVGPGGINATGNTQANNLTGNGSNNFIDGGLASDTLTGAAGPDNFLFTTTLGASNIDTITDFSVVDDTVRLDNAIFTALPVGFLAVAAFHIGTAAADATDRIIYNSTTGALLYDSDGLGGAAAIRFATLSTGLAMTNADIYVF
jgi:Ca2+-binding RTX toxin-like protein